MSRRTPLRKRLYRKRRISILIKDNAQEDAATAALIQRDQLSLGEGCFRRLSAGSSDEAIPLFA